MINTLENKFTALNINWLLNIPKLIKTVLIIQYERERIFHERWTLQLQYPHHLSVDINDDEIECSDDEADAC